MVAIRHVAERAGVSKMSVSRVLNNSPRVNEATRQRVLQAMSELGYLPSAAARSLKRGRTRLLAVLIPEGNNPIYGQYVDGIKDTAEAAGYSMILCKRSGATAQDREASVRLVREQRVAGVVITYSGWREHVYTLLRSGVEVVCLDHRVPGCDRVSLDNAGAMSRAVRHLHGLGHRRIGIVTGPVEVPSERERLVGYRRAARAAGLPLDRALQIVAPGFTGEHGLNAGRRVLAIPGRPTALIVSSSGLTPGVLSAVSEAGLRIPRDLALVGVGEMSWSPQLISPITSLVEPAYEMGVEACRLLLQRLSSDEAGPPRLRRYPARLAVRLSCGAPPELRDVPIRAATSLLFDAVLGTEPQLTPPTAGSVTGRAPSHPLPPPDGRPARPAPAPARTPRPNSPC